MMGVFEKYSFGFLVNYFLKTVPPDVWQGPKHKSVVRRFSVIKAVLKISQKSQENICIGHSFNKGQVWDLDFYFFIKHLRWLFLFKGSWNSLQKHYRALDKTKE